MTPEKKWICPKCLTRFSTFDDAVYCDSHHDTNATIQEIRKGEK